MLSEKTAIITGGGSGIGKGVAKLFSENGANVVIADFSEENGNSAAKEIKNSLFIKTDVSNEESVKNMVEKTVEQFGTIDILVNNAGLQYISKVEDFPIEKWNQLIGVMLTGTFLCTKYSVPYMKKNNWGRIINTSSAHGKEASPWKAAYVSAKHGIIGFTKVIAKELAEFNITANSVCPGYVLTPLVQKQITDLAKQYGISEEEVPEKVLLKDQPIKKLVTVEELSELYLYLASEKAKCITSQAISIDGGWTAH
jgi:3-hydroxybutyrate dehydrogenase